MMSSEIYYGNIIKISTLFPFFFRITLAGLSCLSNPCWNGICIDELNSTYLCYCIDGYTGVQCQTNWDECWSQPCMNGGSCIDGIASYNCTCSEGFVGDNCEINYDECDSNPCENNGTCIDLTNGYLCSCLPGYMGAHCQVDIAVCNVSDELRCANGGQCIEGPGFRFSCRCPPGWTGAICSDSIDECASSPCRNGGICIDAHADYMCACIYGFTGKSCEVEIEFCTNNSCSNNALCVVESNVRVCYCVPDYHGEKCQFQYDECQLGPRCMNGGTCIDGVDNFTCSCPPSLTGLLCECLILDNGSLDCEYSATITTPSIYSGETTYFLTTIQDWDSTTSTMLIENKTTLKPITITLPMNFTSTDVTFASTVPTTFEWDQTTQFELDFTSTTEKLSTEFGRTNKMITSTTEISLTTPTTIKTEETMLPQTPDTTLQTITELNTSNETTISTESQTTSTNPTTANISITTPFSHTICLDRLCTVTRTETNDITSPLTETTVYFTTQTTTLQDTEITEQFLTTTAIPKITTIKSETTTQEPVKTTDMSEIQTIKTESTTEGKETKDKTPKTTQIIMTDTTDKSLGEVTSSDLDTTTEQFFTESPTSSTVLTTTQISPDPYTEMTPFYNNTPLTTTPKADCSSVQCMNGGSCMNTLNGFMCVCLFTYIGEFCERHSSVSSAAFNGNSYLAYKLGNVSAMHVTVTARTYMSDGALLYVEIEPGVYMQLYMEAGLLKFKFSCGYQTMLLSELRTFVNDGFNMKIETLLDLDVRKQYCNATLRINDTVAMSGGQVAYLTQLPSESMLHLGDTPPNVTSANSTHFKLFVGCMHNLIINNEPRDIYATAVEVRDVSECSSLSCLSQPCYNGGSCVDRGRDYHCSCANGFLGVQCEQSICDVNPCLFGGTCTKYPGSGFICLCPLGKHGLYCEHNLEITKPAFSASVKGLSSYIRYSLPYNAESETFDLRFKFQTTNMEQISLMGFVGQRGRHDFRSDHMSVTFVKGYIMLTWNLGSGPRRIFTPRPITDHGARAHQVIVGRRGRTAWLSVDGRFNVSGNAPGGTRKLNVAPYLYIGGHDSPNFSSLPHDLPLHSGFSGCVWEAQAGAVPLATRGSESGRAVGQCGVTQCQQRACGAARGVCVHHAATYACICNEGSFGPTCTMSHNPCDMVRSHCRGFCVVEAGGDTRCDCPYGKTGVYCEKELYPSDVLFPGVRSFLSLHAARLSSVSLALELEVRPMKQRGLILFLETPNFYTSLSIQGGLLEYRWTDRSSGVSSLLVSGVVVGMRQWRGVRAGRYGRRLYLWSEGDMHNIDIQAHTYPHSTDNGTIHLGGVDDLSTLPYDVMSGPPQTFTGCLRRLHVNNIHIPLDSEHITTSRNLADCDGGSCGGDVCQHGGTCVSEGGTVECLCPAHRRGKRCEVPTPCEDSACQPGGRCARDGRCLCFNGWAGNDCQIKINITTPQLNGDGLIMIREVRDELVYKQEDLLYSVGSSTRYKRQVDFVSFNFTTAEPNELLLWIQMPLEYIGVGLEDGYLKLVWSMRADSSTNTSLMKNEEVKNVTVAKQSVEFGSVKLMSGGRLSDGVWHSVRLLLAHNLTLQLDRHPVPLYQQDIYLAESANNNRTLYIGGVPSLPDNPAVATAALREFSNMFRGCMDRLQTSGSSGRSLGDYSHYYSENMHSCQLS